MIGRFNTWGNVLRTIQVTQKNMLFGWIRNGSKGKISVMVNFFNWSKAFFGLKATVETKFANSSKLPAVSQSMLAGRWDSQRPAQSSCSEQKCWPEALRSCLANERDQFSPAAQDVQDHQCWSDERFCAGFWQVTFMFCQFAAKLQPLTQWRSGLFPLPAECKCLKGAQWLIPKASLLPLVSPVATSGQC